MTGAEWLPEVDPNLTVDDAREFGVARAEAESEVAAWEAEQRRIAARRDLAAAVQAEKARLAATISPTNPTPERKPTPPREIESYAPMWYAWLRIALSLAIAAALGLWLGDVAHRIGELTGLIPKAMPR